MACFRLLPRLMVTVRHPGKQCNKLSALSWKLGGQVFISICRMGMASAAIMAWDFATSIGMVDQECFNKHSVSNTASWASSLPDLRAPTKWGIHRVAASEICSLGKLLNITFMVLKTSSLMVAVDHNSLSKAAARQNKKLGHCKFLHYQKDKPGYIQYNRRKLNFPTACIFCRNTISPQLCDHLILESITMKAWR